MKTILLTGANGNLGQVAAEVLLKKGFAVEAAVGRMNDAGAPNADHYHAESVDLLDALATGAYVERVAKRNGGIDGAVLLVGGYAAGGLAETDSAAIDKMIALNFKTAYHIVRPLFEHLKTGGGGKVVLVGAKPALDPASGQSQIAYALSKSLIFELAKLINETGKSHNIDATVVVPGTIDTAANRAANPDADFSKWVSPEAIAEGIAGALSGDNASEKILFFG
jgi:NAD(P)-dependent dehydrogenase (short-subunit alcohol dehydrogenase family)